MSSEGKWVWRLHLLLRESKFHRCGGMWLEPILMRIKLSFMRLIQVSMLASDFQDPKGSSSLRPVSTVENFSLICPGQDCHCTCIIVAALFQAIPIIGCRKQRYKAACLFCALILMVILHTRCRTTSTGSHPVPTLIYDAGAAVTSETLYLDANNPSGQFKVVLQRQNGEPWLTDPR